MGFNIPFYIIFGTNLLTESLVQIAVFLPISVFRKKEYQTESKWNLTLGRVIFRTNAIQQTWSGRQGRNEVATRQGGAPPTLVGPSWLHQPTYSSYKYPYTPKTSRSTTKPYFHPATFCTREIPSWGLFRRSNGGGIDHGGLLHQHHSLSDDV